MPELHDNWYRLPCKAIFRLEFLTDLVVGAGKIESPVLHGGQSRPVPLVEVFESKAVPMPELSPELRRLPCFGNCGVTMPISRTNSAAP